MSASTTTSASLQQEATSQPQSTSKALSSIAMVNKALEEAKVRLDRLSTRLSAVENHLELDDYCKKQHMDANIMRTDIGMQGEAVTRLMFELDGIESGGDAAVRAMRKACVKACDAVLGEQESLLARATEFVQNHAALQKKSATDISSASDKEDEAQAQSSTTNDNSSNSTDSDGDKMVDTPDSDSESMSVPSHSSSDEDEDGSGGRDKDMEQATAPAKLVSVAGGRAQLRVHMSGVDPDSVDASICNNILTITGRHFQAGRVEHCFCLPDSIDHKSAQILSCSQPCVLVIEFMATAFVAQQQHSRQQRQRRLWRQQQLRERRARLQELQQQEAQSHCPHHPQCGFGATAQPQMSHFGGNLWSDRTHKYVPHSTWF
jgi:HSP20 family molecular chaperone IbpA